MEPPRSGCSPEPWGVIAIRQISEAYKRLLKSDMKDRFVIEMASLQ
jgi:D-arabinose 1-dehydrogenase-like Zn-dependent alcohol dehydrogenase